MSRINPQIDWDDFNPWNFDGWDLQALPTPVLPDNPPFQIGVLNWPTGSSRPAWFHEVVNTDKLEEIREAVGDPMVPKQLLMRSYREFGTDKGSTQISVPMYLLPPRPLVQMGEKDLWLLTLSDQRFYFMWRRGNITARPADWPDLFDQLATILGIEIDVDDISPTYTRPSDKWIGYQRPTAAVLDAAATQIGHRVVFNLDGSVRTVNWQTARSECDAYFNDVDPLLLAGGFLSASDLGRYVPSQVRTLFANVENGETQPDPYIVTSYLGSLSPLLSGLASSVFGFSSGFPWATGIIMGDLVYDGSNATGQVNPYASGAAFDWYGWRGSHIDVVFPAIEEYDPTGWEDFIEWTYQRRDEEPYSSTRVRRGPWDDFASGNWFAGLEPPTSGAGGGGTICEGHGWLDNAKALEAAADLDTGNDPPRVITYRVHEGLGWCSCVPEQFTEAAASPYDGIAQAFWDGTGTHTWTGTRAIHTCYGCAIPVISIPGDKTHPDEKITVQLSLTATGDGTAKTYDLKYHCATATGVLFAMSGPKICPENAPPIDCDNVAYLEFLCGECSIPNTDDCEFCNEVCTPSLLKVVITGLTNNDGDRTAYNGTWILEYDELTGCSWTNTCGPIVLTLTLTMVGSDTVLTLTGTGGAVGITASATTVGDLWPCFTVSGMTITQPSPSTAGTVEITPIFCEVCDDKACGKCSETQYDTLKGSTLYVTFSGAFAPDPNPVPVTYSVIDGWWTATVNFCDREVDVIIKCVDLNNWSLTLQFHAIAGCDLTGPTDELFTDVDCDPLMLFGEFSAVNVSGGGCTCATGDYSVIATVTL